MYLHICTNERHKCCILSMQPSEMLLYALNLGFFYPGFCNLPSSLRGKLYFTGIANSHMDFKLQTTNHSGRTIFQCTQAH